MIRSDSIEVEVCGYESITGLEGFSGIDATEGEGWIFSKQAFNEFFERGLNSSSCPIVGYELRDKNDLSLEDHA